MQADLLLEEGSGNVLGVDELVAMAVLQLCTGPTRRHHKNEGNGEADEGGDDGSYVIVETDLLRRGEGGRLRGEAQRKDEDGEDGDEATAT